MFGVSKLAECWNVVRRCFPPAGLNVHSFHRVHSAMTEEFANIVDEASAAFENLKILGAREFVTMKPSDGPF